MMVKAFSLSNRAPLLSPILYSLVFLSVIFISQVLDVTPALAISKVNTTPTTALPSQLEIVSMNLRWYGSSKFPPHNDDERDEHLKVFFKTYYPQTSLFLFQEITDPERLQKTIGSPYKCLSGKNYGRSYQYVVTCYHSQHLKALTNTPKDMYDETRDIDISFGKHGLRNALHLEFSSIKHPNKTLSTINLHLRAGYDQSDFRIQQMQALFEELVRQGLNKKTGLLIAGDLNSFGRKTTGQKKDDIYLYLDKADQYNLDLFTEFGLTSHLSYRYNRFFDYILMPKSQWLSSYDMFVACSDQASPESDSYENKVHYKNFISDHCPISLKVPLKDL